MDILSLLNVSLFPYLPYPFVQKGVKGNLIGIQLCSITSNRHRQNKDGTKDGDPYGLVTLNKSDDIFSTLCASLLLIYLHPIHSSASTPSHSIINARITRHIEPPIHVGLVLLFSTAIVLLLPQSCLILNASLSLCLSIGVSMGVACLLATYVVLCLSLP